MPLLTAYRRFDGRDVHAASGWDAWAEDYARLPAENTTYATGKQLLYEALEPYLPRALNLDHTVDVLDFNCGCGNDVPFFLQHGYRVTGCDQSPGMLAVAQREFTTPIAQERLTLYEGSAENLVADTFGDTMFDVIFAGTGSLAYVDDEELKRIHSIFTDLLRPGGVLLITHLQPRCLAETLYHVLRGQPRRALQRWRRSTTVSIRGVSHTMYLRGPRHLRALLGTVAPPTTLVPLGVVVPPFQSGCMHPRRWTPGLLKLEAKASSWPLAQFVCDQLLYVHVK